MAIGEIIGKAVRDDFRVGDFRGAIKQKESTEAKMTKKKSYGRTNSYCDISNSKKEVSKNHSKNKPCL